MGLMLFNFINKTGLKYMLIVLTMQFLLSLGIDPLLNNYYSIEISCEANETPEEIFEMHEFLLEENDSKTVLTGNSVVKYITRDSRLLSMCQIDIPPPPPKTV